MQVQLTRGDVVESVHQVEAVVSDLDGPVTVWGDAGRPVIARSAIKFVQAMPLLRSGAADRFAVSDDELILACASHSAEPAHVDAVRAWLQRIGLDESALECGPDVPYGADTAADQHRQEPQAKPIFNCCSGKHTGFLAVAMHLGHDPAGYIEPGHPVQRLVTESIEQWTGHRLGNQKPGRDGCGIPTFAVPLEGLANAMVGLAAPAGLASDLADPARRLAAANHGRQFWISGTGRREMILAEAANEPLMIKAGAEGVFMVGLPDRGLGITLKVLDGASRAAEVAVSALLARLGVVPQTAASWSLSNKAGDETGTISVHFDEPTMDRS